MRMIFKNSGWWLSLKYRENRIEYEKCRKTSRVLVIFFFLKGNSEQISISSYTLQIFTIFASIQYFIKLFKRAREGGRKKKRCIRWLPSSSLRCAWSSPPPPSSLLLELNNVPWMTSFLPWLWPCYLPNLSFSTSLVLKRSLPSFLSWWQIISSLQTSPVIIHKVILKLTWERLKTSHFF